MFELRKRVVLPGGGSVTVTIKSPEPINVQDYLVLQPQAAAEMAECLISMANALRPPESLEVTL